MTHLVSWSIRHRSVVILLALLVIIVGIFSTLQFPEELLPNIAFPDVIVITQAPGLSAQQVDASVTQPLYDAVRGTTGISDITSTSSDGSSVLEISFDLSTDPTTDVHNIQSALQSVALPSQAQPPTVNAVSISATPIEYLAVTPKPGESLAKLGQYVNSSLLPSLSRASGVSQVSTIGIPEENVIITVNPKSMLTYHVSTNALVNALQTNTLTGELGTIQEHQYQLGIDITPAPGLLAALGQLRIPTTVGSTVPLSTVAAVTPVPNPSSGLAYYNGKPAISFSIMKGLNANLISTVANVNTVLNQARSDIGQNSVHIIYQSAQDVQDSVNGLFHEALFGAILAMIVIFFFLFSVRATLVTVISLPTSILFALSLAHLANLTLNIMTMAGLTVAVGRVVDDAIVVLENIYRHYQAGESIQDAAITGTHEVMNAIASSTLSTILVFAPIAVVGGIISSFFLSFSLIVGLALVASFFVAITLIPVLATLFLRPLHHKPGTRTLGERTTQPLLTRVINRPILQGTVLVIAAVLFLGTVPLGGKLPQQLIPPAKEKGMSLSITLPSATTFQDTLRSVAPFSTKLTTQIAGISTAELTVGGEEQAAGISITSPPNRAQFTISLNSSANVDTTVTAVRTFARKQFPNAVVSVQSFSFSPDSGAFQATLTAPTQSLLDQQASQLRSYIASLPHATDVVVSTSLNEPRIAATLNSGEVASTALTQQDIQSTLPFLLGHQKITSISSDGYSVPVYLGLIPSANPLGVIAQVPLGTKLTQFGSVATFSSVQAPAAVDRFNGQPSATIEATFTGSTGGNDALSLQHTLEKRQFPTGVAITFSGSSQSQLGSIFSNMGLAALVAVVLIFLLLVIFFGSLGVPLVILVALPLASIGALILMSLTSTPLGLPSLMGLLMLIGIVVSNSILLVDFIRQGQRNGLPVSEAIIQAGTTRTRPILMTAVVTIAALLPLALGLSGGGALISQGLGVAVIGGLITSTLLTLIVVPTTFRVGHRLKNFR